MRNEAATLAEFQQRESLARTVTADAPPARDGPRDVQAAAESGWQAWAFLFVTLGLLGYGSYLGWDALIKLVPAVKNPASPDFVVIGLAIRVVAPLLPPLAYLVVWLSGRRETSWTLSAGAVGVLGLLTAVIEVCAHALA